MDTSTQSGPADLVASGDRSFEEIMAAYETALLRYTARLVNDVSAAQDIVQETFIKLLHIWRNGARATANLRPWLYRVAHNTAIDYIRRENRLRRLHEREAAERPAPAIKADHSDDYAKKIQMALEQLRHLNPAERQVVILRIQEGLSYREISLVTGRTEGNVGCILHQAVKKITAHLKKAGLISQGGLP